jgi:hypothetical protein
VTDLLNGLSARLTVAIALAVTAILLPCPPAALNPDLTVKQLHHTAGDPGQGAPLGGVISIFAPRSAGLWIGFTFGGAALLKDGHWQAYTAENGLPAGSPNYFAETRDGVLWVAMRNRQRQNLQCTPYVGRKFVTRATVSSGFSSGKKWPPLMACPSARGAHCRQIPSGPPSFP